MNKTKGFSLIELLVVITIISLLASGVFVAVSGLRSKARDTKRKYELSQIGRLFTASSCYVPEAGAGDYDLAQLADEIRVKYPQAAQLASLPADPKSGSQTQTNYRYQVTADNHCIIYANLENENEPITLPAITQPTAASGTGVFQSSTEGANGTTIFYQTGK